MSREVGHVAGGIVACTDWGAGVWESTEGRPDERVHYVIYGCAGGFIALVNAPCVFSATLVAERWDPQRLAAGCAGRCNMFFLASSERVLRDPRPSGGLGDA